MRYSCFQTCRTRSTRSIARLHIDTSPSSECTSRACLLEELSASNRQRPLSGPLLTLLEILAEGSQGAAPAGEVMPEPVAPGDVAATIDPRGVFGSADATVTEECTVAPTVAEGRFAAPTVREGGNGASTADAAEVESAAGDAAPTEVGSTEAVGRPMVAEGSTEAGGGTTRPRAATRPRRGATRPRKA